MDLKILPKIAFSLVDSREFPPRTSEIIVDRNGLKAIVGQFEKYEVLTGEISSQLDAVWYHPSGKVKMIAHGLSYKNIDDFINDDISAGAGLGILGLGLLGGVAIASSRRDYDYGPGYGYGPAYYPTVYPYYTRPYPVSYRYGGYDGGHYGSHSGHMSGHY